MILLLVLLASSRLPSTSCVLLRQHPLASSSAIILFLILWQLRLPQYLPAVFFPSAPPLFASLVRVRCFYSLCLSCIVAGCPVILYFPSFLCVGMFCLLLRTGLSKIRKCKRLYRTYGVAYEKLLSVADSLQSSCNFVGNVMLLAGQLRTLRS